MDSNSNSNTDGWHWIRSRRFVAAAVAVCAVGAVGVGVGVVQLTSAASGSTPSSFVPITPCRLFDTRPAPDNVGPRSTPIGAGDTFVAAVRGTNGRCNIPANATAVVMNVSITDPSADSVLTVYPSDEALPQSSNLNWQKGQAPTPNQVTATLSADGHLSFWNLFGTVNVLADIAGYFQPATTATQGPPGIQGATGPQGPSGATRASGRITVNPLAVDSSPPGLVTGITQLGAADSGDICVTLDTSAVPTASAAVVVATPDNTGDSTDVASGKYSIVESRRDSACAGNSLHFVTGYIDASVPIGTGFFKKNEPFYFIVA
jgi:hypothetical protein